MCVCARVCVAAVRVVSVQTARLCQVCAPVIDIEEEDVRERRPCSAALDWEAQSQHQHCHRLNRPARMRHCNQFLARLAAAAA